MNENSNEIIEIAELEYDVGSVGSEESADSQTSYAAFVLYADMGNK
jgi:hypothetical protein